MGRPRLEWIKLYQQILTSDIMTLPESYRWNFIGLLLVASNEPERGKIRPHWLQNNRKLLANFLGTSTKLLANSVQSLAELGAIIEDDSGISIINYQQYQAVTPNKPDKKEEKTENTTEGFFDENKRENKSKNKEEEKNPPNPPKGGNAPPLEKPKRKNFKKPSPSEVTEYAKSIDFDLDGEQFCDYYEARGWKYGTGKPMVDWKAAVRTWRKHETKRQVSATEDKLSPGIQKWLDDSLGNDCENQLDERMAI
jgi:hypothetical protein